MKSATLVLLHGYPFDHTMWYGVIASLGSGAKVLAPDLPGFGHSPVPDQEPSLDLMADAVLKLLDENEIPKVVLGGMSMGGYVALAFAEKYPTRLAGLALINSQSIADTDETRQARRAMISKVRTEGIGAALQAIVPKLFAPEKATNPDYTSFPAEGAAKAGVPGITWALEAMARRPDRTRVLKELRIPVLIMHGTADQIVPLERARAMAEGLREGSFVPIKGIGHCSPVEAPEAIAQGLRALAERAFNPEEVPAE